MLELDLAKSYSNGDALQFHLEINFNAKPGITVLFGPSGSGKSSTLHIISGITTPDKGRVVVNGNTFFDSGRGVNLPMRQRKIGYLFQQLAIFPHMSVMDNVAFGIDGPKNQTRKKAVEWLERFGIKDLAERNPASISGGEKQRVALARALAPEPQLLLLDEPLSALDAATKRTLMDEIREVEQSRDIPIIYVTHDQAETIALGARVLVYEQGRIIADGQPLDVFSQPKVETVASLSGVENIYTARVIKQSEERGTMTCDLGGCRIDVPFGAVKENIVRVAIRAGDILLSAIQPKAISARNILEGRLRAIESIGHDVHAVVDCGVDFRVTITPQAQDELGLEVGSPVWLIIKTHSCYLLR